MFVFIGQMMILTEEEHLSGFFGEQYHQYCEMVPRYLGLKSIGVTEKEHSNDLGE
jgi:protein-S-isoprenylcysteine O-methyltransferase Ste14